MSYFFSLVLIILVVYVAIFVGGQILLRKKLKKAEGEIVDVFLQKIAKIPALIEVMRPYVVDESAFDLITSLHSQSMIHAYNTIYDLLEHNARIQDQFGFLMRLSMQIPDLQTKEYFVYIRDFVMSYDRTMRSRFSLYNSSVVLWNRLIDVQHWTIIGWILPGRSLSNI